MISVQRNGACLRSKTLLLDNSDNLFNLYGVSNCKLNSSRSSKALTTKHMQNFLRIMSFTVCGPLPKHNLTEHKKFTSVIIIITPFDEGITRCYVPPASQNFKLL